MKPTDLLFQAFSNLTGGLITDLTTAMVGMIGLMILVKGAKKLLSVFEDRILEDQIKSEKLDYDWAVDSGQDNFEISYRRKKINRLYNRKLDREFGDY